MKKILSIALGVTLALAASAEDATLSGGIPEIVKLSKSGVAPSVVEQYISSSQFPFRVSVDDVLYMHKEGVSDEVITALMRRGDELRRSSIALQGAEMPMRGPAPAQIQTTVPVPTPAPAYYAPTQPMDYVAPATTYVDPYAYSAPYYPDYYGYGPYFYPSFSLGFGVPFRGGFGHGFSHGGFSHGGGGFSHGGFSHGGGGFSHGGGGSSHGSGGHSGGSGHR